jgi:hypothetical protein
MTPIRINCTTDTCPNYQTVHGDSFVPPDWYCSACEDHHAEEAVKAFARRVARHILDTPLKETR